MTFKRDYVDERPSQSSPTYKRIALQPQRASLLLEINGQRGDWLALHNFSDCTIEKRALYVRAFGLWCLERDIVTPLSITKPMLEAFQRHLYRHRQVLFVSLGKGQKDRYVPIGLRALTWIARYVQQARPQLSINLTEQTLFLTVDRTPLHPDSLTEYGRRYLKRAGIEKPGACHIFRHTMATLMHDNGADIRTIQAILGHESLDTTQIYTRVGLKKLLETHAQTHPAERPTEPPGSET